MENPIYKEVTSKLWHKGMPITRKEFEQLAKLIDKATNSILINVGQQQLKAYLLAYRIREVLKNAKSHEEIKKLLDSIKHAPALDTWTTTAAVNAIAKMTGVKPVTLAAEKMAMDYLQDYMFGEITWHMDDMQSKIRQAALESLMNREGPIALARKLHKVFDTYDYDMRRVAITETTRARNKGTLNSIKAEDPRGDEALVYFMVAKDACPDCKRLYLYPDGSPRLFRIKDIENVTNKGKKKAEWTAGLLIHPNDRCYPVAYNPELEEWRKKWQARIAGKSINKSMNDPCRKIVDMHGVKIAVEWPKGSTRTYTDIDVETPMKADYGYIKGTNGTDDMDLDVYVGPHHESKKVFRLDQMKKDGSFDEYKYLLGYNSAGEALKSYREHMPEWMEGKAKEISWAAFEHDIATNLQAPEIGKSLGAEKPGHKYISRERDPKTGEWRYTYGDPKTKVSWHTEDGKIELMAPDEYIERVHVKNRMSPEEYKERTDRAIKHGLKGLLPYPPKSEESLKKLHQAIKAGATIRAPWLEYREDGTLAAQEGYHRATAAKEAGIKQIPVRIIRRDGKSLENELQEVLETQKAMNRRATATLESIRSLEKSLAGN